MSFYTSLKFYRPTKPPRITGDEMSRFVADIRKSGVLTDSGLQSAESKFGDSIDQDNRATTWEDDSGPLATVRGIEWDVELDAPGGLQGIIDTLADDNRPIYRASLTLGMPTDAVLEPITRRGSPENEIDLTPDTLSIEAGPVEVYDLNSEGPFRVGWIGINLHGYGYLYPRTFRDLRDRLMASEAIGKLTELCRSTWPVPPTRPNWFERRKRRRMKDLWPYSTIDLPWDWYWGLAESG
jgi:hypothetical protein